jgi:hypothetical protein
MKSVVKMVQLTGNWKNKFGEFDQYAVEFEDGTEGEFSVKKGNKPRAEEGQEMEYEITGKSPKGTPKIKFLQEQGGGGGGRGGGYQSHSPEQRKGINACNALNNAVALVNAGKVEEKVLLPCAEKLFTWLESKGGGEQ